MSEALSEKEISGGVVHDLPADLKRALTSDAKALETWEDITPLARNEWICWMPAFSCSFQLIHADEVLSAHKYPVSLVLRC